MADQLFETLRDRIIAGVLEPGTRLSAPAIAIEEDVSRSPAREAISRLVSEGLATEQPHRGATVRRIENSDIISLYEVREVLEGLVTRLAVENKGQLFITQLEETLAADIEAVSANDQERHMDLDMKFHAQIRLASENQDAIDLLQRIQTQVRLAMHTTVVTAGPENAIEDHKAILSAIRAGDPSGAERAARKHIARLTASLGPRSASVTGARVL